jgi:ribosome-associated protein
MVSDEGVRVRRGLVIPEAELRWRFDAAGGPGGQHANTANTRAELRFDIAGSPTLGPRQRARLLAKIGPEIRVVAAGRRSQARNRSEARERLASRLADALAVEPTRVPTRSTRAAKERRLEAKRRQSRRKASRGRVTSDD